MSVTFRFARVGEYQRISDFLDQYWAKAHIYCRNAKLFDWTFRRSGHWDPEQYSVSLGEDGDQLIGILGGIPFSFNHYGKICPSVWIVNYVIRPDYRKGASALQLLSTFRRPEFDPVIAYGINPATTAIYKVLRGRVLPPIPRSIVLLPEAKDRFAEILHVAYPLWTRDQIEESSAAFIPETLPDEDAPVGREIPAEWNTNEWPEIAKTTVGAARDLDFLTWRYKNHPVFEYRFLSIREGERSGLLVWRLETIRKQIDAGREDMDRIGRLVEFLPVSQSNAKQLVSAFVKELRATDAVGADFYGFHGETRQWLSECGFISTATRTDGNAIPSRFQPLDGKGGEILSAMFLRDPLPECNTALDCPWYWTKADSDQDRPN